MEIGQNLEGLKISFGAERGKGETHRLHSLPLLAVEPELGELEIRLDAQPLWEEGHQQ